MTKSKTKTKKIKKVATYVETIAISFKEMFANATKSIYDIVSKPDQVIATPDLEALMAPFNVPGNTNVTLTAGYAKALLGAKFDEVAYWQAEKVPFCVVVTHVKDDQEFIYAMVTSIEF